MAQLGYGGSFCCELWLKKWHLNSHLLAQCTEPLSATDYLNLLLVLSISWTFVWVKLRKKPHDVIAMTHLNLRRYYRWAWALTAKILPGMGLVIGIAIKEVVRSEAKFSIFLALLGSSACAPVLSGCPPSCLCCSRNCCWYGYISVITVIMRLPWN